jgi:cell shape-determining protein MreC
MSNSKNITSFLGSLLVMAIAISIFFMLMTTEMPASNRELLIAFVSVLFGAMAGSIKKITGDDDSAQMLSDLEKKNQALEQRIKDLTENK